MIPMEPPADGDFSRGHKAGVMVGFVVGFLSARPSAPDDEIAAAYAFAREMALNGFRMPRFLVAGGAA